MSRAGLWHWVGVLGLGVVSCVVGGTEAGSGRPPVDQAVRDAVSAGEAVLSCARGVFEKPVFATEFRPRIADATCKSTKAELLREFDRIGLRVFESPKGVVLAPAWRFSVMPEIAYTWTRATVEITTELLEGSGSMSTKEQDLVARAILRQARTLPLALPWRPTGNTGDVTITVGIWMAKVDVSPRRREVVAYWGRLNGWRRVVYGDLNDAEYRMVWDSPVLTGTDPAVHSVDVDGDGQTELATEARFGARPTETLLSVFTRGGAELTRQEECTTDLSDTQGFAIACPIRGEEVRFDRAPNGRLDILTDGDEGPHRYVLVDDKYERSRR